MASKIKKLIRSQSTKRQHRHVIEFLQAVKDENITVVKKLLKEKIKILNPITWEKHLNEFVYPIHIGCALGSVEIVKVLLSIGCSFDTKTVSGLTPLHFAAMYNITHPEVIEHLLDMGAKYCVKDKFRSYTVFHCACESGNFGAVKKLLKVSSGHVTDSIGKTPRDIAEENKYENITALFEKFDFEEKQKKEITELPKRMRALERRTEIIFQRQRHVTSMQSRLAVDSGLGESLSDLHNCSTSSSNLLTVPANRDIFVGSSVSIQSDFQNKNGRFSWNDRSYLSASQQRVSCQPKHYNEFVMSRTQYSKSTENCAELNHIKDSAMADIYKEQILKKYKFLCSNMKPQRLVIKLFSKGHFQIDTKEILDHIPTDYSKNDYLLSKIVLKGTMGLYKDFIRSLKDSEQPHIVQELTSYVQWKEK